MASKISTSTDGVYRWMHTLNGKPAAFDGQQVCYWWRNAPLAKSLKQIKREQVASTEWRRERGLSDAPGDSSYGHIIIRI